MGENGAGKSTLLKCLFGIYQKDSGTILFRGKEIDFHSAKEALENGISMVHRELNLGITTFGDGQHVAGAISHQRHVCRSGQNVPRNQSDF